MSTCLLVSFLLFHHPLSAQILPGITGLRYNTSYLSAKSGLPNDNVNDIFADSYGFVWISTYGGGLVRYDGYGYHQICDNVPSSKACKNVCEDRFKRLWVAYDERISVIDLKTLGSVVPSYEKGDLQALLSQPAVRVYEDTLHRIWLVTKTNIYLLTFNESGGVNDIATCKYTANTPDIVLSDVNNDGKVWVSLEGTLVQLEKRGDKLVKCPISPGLKPLDNLYITDMLRQGSNVWIASNDGLYRFDSSNRTLELFRHSVSPNSLSHNYVTDLQLDETGNLMAGTLNGVNFYRRQTRDFEVWNSSTTPASLPSDFVNCIFLLHKQVWVGTENSGIIKLTPRHLELTNYFHTANPGSLSANLVNAMWAEPNGRIWVGTVEGGLNRMDPGTNDFVHYNTANSALPHNTVSTLTVDNSQRLWVGTWGGGVGYIDLDNPAKVYTVAVDEEYRKLITFVGALAYDEYNGGLWIGSNDGMFFYDNKTGKIIEPFKECREVRGCIGAVIDNSGKLWMGCVSGMRVVDLKSRNNGTFNVSSIIYRPDNQESKNFDHITSFCLSADGSLWIGSNFYGLYHYYIDKHGKEHFDVLNTDDGLPNNSIKGIAEDADGRLWITTGNGLVLYSKENKTFANYTEDDGLRNSEFYWNSIVRQGNKFYLGTKNGFTIIEGKNNNDFYAGRLSLTGLTVDNQPAYAGSGFIDEDISVAEVIYLHESNKSFSIDFSILNFDNKQHGTYCYRMRGLEKEWINLKPGEHSVRYSTLPPGEYVFEVKYNTAIDGTEGQHVKIKVKVAPYFYKSWWFILLVLIVVISFITYLYNAHVRHLKQTEAEKLLGPIKKILDDAHDPELFMSRMRKMLTTEEKYKNSFSKSVQTDKENVSRKLGRPFVDRCVEVIEKNYMNSDFGIEEFCQQIGMSRAQVNKNLNAEAGMPAGQFIRNYRLNMARELMTKNKANRNITEIAYSVGFNDPKYFTRCFTRLYGVAPRTFQSDGGKEKASDAVAEAAAQPEPEEDA